MEVAPLQGAQPFVRSSDSVNKETLPWPGVQSDFLQRSVSIETEEISQSSSIAHLH